jgi:hypothetical protein
VAEAILPTIVLAVLHHVPDSDGVAGKLSEVVDSPNVEAALVQVVVIRRFPRLLARTA